MPPSPSGPRYGTVAADAGGGGTAWSPTANALVEDGSTADALNIGPGGGGTTANDLLIKTFGFNIPANAIIDGIVLEIKVNATRASTPSVRLTYNGGTSAQQSTSNPLWGTTGLTWLTYGGPTELWGKAWTGADINNANFGAALNAMPVSGSGWTLSVDSARITVYWHSAPADVPKRYLYKVFDNATGTYIGNLPNVISEFGYAQDINSAGASITVECASSPDTANQPADTYVDAAGAPYTDEAATYNYTTEGVIPQVALGSSGLPVPIRNGNRIIVYEYSYYYPNGIAVFSGQINNWAAGFGGKSGDTTKLFVLSDSLDLDNYVARGAPFTYATDQSQTSQNASEGISTMGPKGAGYNWSGQSFTVGAGVTNIGAITLMLNGTANVTVAIYDSSALLSLKGSVTQAVSVGGATAIQFAFAIPVVVTPGTSYFIQISVDSGQSITIYYQNTNVYANGQHYAANYSGGSGGGSFAPATGDLYFVTGSSTGSTTGTYTSQDPSTGMLKPIIDDYRARGGIINYGATTVDVTGLSLTVTFNTESILDAIKRILSVSPSGFYFYVDLGTDTLYFKKQSTTADFTLIKGKHIEDLNLKASIENIKNQVLFSGGATAGVNLYKQYQDQTSIDLYGIRLDRKSDNRVTVSATADAIGNTGIATQKDEQYSTTLTVLDKTMDTQLLKVGKTIGFAGYGTFVDNLILQIVRVEYSPEEVNLTLGVLPKRMNPEIEKITRGLLAQQTVANPTAPS